MESSVSSLPMQGQGQGQGDMGSSIQGAAAASSSSSSTTSTSGSIGPFFAVISVLTFLAIASCVVGRICIRRRLRTTTAAPMVVVTPLDTIKYGGWLGWLKLKCRHCIMAGEVVEVGGGAKVMSIGEDKTNDTHEPPQV